MLVAKNCVICRYQCGLIHKNQLCYTDEDFLIYTISVFVPPYVENEVVRDFFLKFGPIVELKCIKQSVPSSIDSISREERIVLIRFRDASSAARSLSDRLNMMKMFRSVRAESWQQPNYSIDCCIPPLLPKSNTKNYLLTEINNDCFFYVCQKLPLNDHIKLFPLSKRFQDTFEAVYRRSKELYLNNEILEELTSLQLYETFFKIGKHLRRLTYKSKVESVDLPYNEYDFLCVRNPKTKYLTDFIIDFCGQLKYIHFDTIGRISCYILKDMIPIIHNLQSFSFINSKLTDKNIKCLIIGRVYEFEESIEDEIKVIPKIEYLDISNNYLITGTYLSNFHHVITLNLSNCISIEPEHFVLICQYLKKLKILNICNCVRLNEHAFRQMVRLCKTLEDLTITTNYMTNELEILTELPNLKDIAISETSSNSYFEFGSVRLSYLIERLAAKKSPKLRTFKMYTDNDLDDTGLGAILSLKELTELHLEGRCYQRYFWFGIACMKNLKVLNLHGNFAFFQSEFFNYLIKAKQLEEIYIRWGSPDVSAILKACEVVNRLEGSKALYMKVRCKKHVKESIVKEPGYLRKKRHVCLDFFDETDNYNYLEYPFKERRCFP